MEAYLLILVLIFLWIMLNKQIGGVEKKLDSLKKEMETWKKAVEKQPVSPDLSPEKESHSTAPEKIVSVENKKVSTVTAPALEKETEVKLNAEPEVSGIQPPKSRMVVLAVHEEEKSLTLRNKEEISKEEGKISSPEESVKTSAILSYKEKSTEISSKEPKTTEKETPLSALTKDFGFHRSDKSSGRKNINYEKYIGENLFSKIGILILVVGIGLFVKYAIDKDWINEVFRTILGFVAGSGLLFVAERLQKKYRTFSSLLAGGAFAIFYVTTAIAFHYYGIFSQTAAFIILIVITIFMSVLSLLYDRRELAVIALIGGFIAPFLVSRGEGNYIICFTYLSILNIGMFGLALYKKWSELPIISFLFTYVIMFLFVIDIRNEYGIPVTPRGFIDLLLFATLFYLIFLLPVISILKNETPKMNRLLLWVIVANNFIYLGFGLYYLNNILTPVRLNGLLTLFVAIVNLAIVLWLRKERQDFRFLVYTMLGLVLTFVSITVPIQLEGNYITLFWAAEMVVLLWLYIRSGIRIYEYFAALMVAATFISCIMDIDYSLFDLWGQAYSISQEPGSMFFNGLFATVLFTGIAFLTFAFLLQKHKSFFETGKIIKYYHWNAGTLFIGIAFIYYNFIQEFIQYLPAGVNIQTVYLFTVAAILLLSYVFKKRFPVKDFLRLYGLGELISVGLSFWDLWISRDNLPEGTGTWYLPWLTMSVTFLILFYVSRNYYTEFKSNLSHTNKYTVFLNVMAVFFWLGIVNRFLEQLSLPDEFNAGFSIALTIAAFVQMMVGMRLHWKVMRVISLFSFGIVLVKLVLSDLWLMPTVGKILVFIMLGIILLILSFLYQKLKDVLFKDDANEK
ncbi:DUF2339 domain-containing protein [Parabacteroides pacaensis]|uniref:DUF2339 domain-containing protein n=1 Tax=Parabacteroides pacaensis TaxID=2086575 RepID=UPI000D0E8C30|nr:DUF2339 domain-containing protein [Parabacteroides pacaensis]